MEHLNNNIKSVYIHIPFCKSICSYCDFCKMYYNESLVSNYLDALNKEINKYYKKDILRTIYIGGGTPSSLSYDNLIKLFNIIKVFKTSKDLEFTFECNIDDIDEKLLKLLYKNKVNRLSIGVESFHPSNLEFLGRSHDIDNINDKISLCKSIGFKNINIDLIYAIPNETIDILNEDIKEFLNLDIPHISLYSLIIEPHTILYNKKVKNIEEDIDYDMYKLIVEKLKDNGYNHYEISNFAKDGYQSIHNLTYWNNENYYGFGLGASGYIKNTRYDNTKNINKYINGIYKKEEVKLSFNETIENEFILGLRKMDGISISKFKEKYNINIKDIDVVKRLLKEEKLVSNKDNIFINEKYLYTENDILIEFLDQDYEIVKGDKRCYN